MTPFDQARALLEASEKATPGPWHSDTDNAMSAVYGPMEDGLAYDILHEPDAAFIVLARNAAPSLAEFVDGPVRELVEAARWEHGRRNRLGPEFCGCGLVKEACAYWRALTKMEPSSS
jgi:hypothetical protein